MKRRIIKTTFMAEFQVIDLVQVCAVILRTRCGNSEKTYLTISLRIPAIGNVPSLVGKANAVDMGDAVFVEQADFLAIRIKLEIRVQAKIRAVLIGPYQKIPSCGDSGKGSHIYGNTPLHGIGQIIR